MIPPAATISSWRKGISGGNPTIAGYALAAGIGTQLEQYAPMSQWKQGYSEYQRYNSYYRMKSSDVLLQVNSSSTATIQQWIMESGAVSAAFYSKSTFYDNGESIAYYQNSHSATDADHAVLLVGWDNNYSRKNFDPETSPSLTAHGWCGTAGAMMMRTAAISGSLMRNCRSARRRDS